MSPEQPLWGQRDRILRLPSSVGSGGEVEQHMKLNGSRAFLPSWSLVSHSLPLTPEKGEDTHSLVLGYCLGFRVWGWVATDGRDKSDPQTTLESQLYHHSGCKVQSLKSSWHLRVSTNFLLPPGPGGRAGLSRRVLKEADHAGPPWPGSR